MDLHAIQAAFAREGDPARRVRFARSAASTQALARESAGEIGLVVVADHQSAGRGRRGRTWESAPGANLLWSLVLAGPAVPRRTLAWAAAMAGELDVFVKWPNDLVDEGDRKLGGVLAEVVPAHPGREAVILGVGLNVNQREFPGLPAATSLALVRGSGDLDRPALLARLVHAVERAHPDDLDPWRARSRTLGRRVRVGAVEGVATSVRDDGALLVGGQAVLAGDVEVVPG